MSTTINSQLTPQLPSLELIEANHTFPTMFSFKAIGDFRTDYVADVLNSPLVALGEARNINHSVKLSSNKNHVSVSLSVRCTTSSEVHLIYQALLKIKGLRALF